MKDTALSVIEGAKVAGRLFQRQAVAHGEGQALLRDCLASFLEGVGRSRDRGDPFRLKLVLSPREGSQLLRAIWSPMGPIDQEDPPPVAKAVGHGHAPVGHGLQSQRGEEQPTRPGV